MTANHQPATSLPWQWETKGRPTRLYSPDTRIAPETVLSTHGESKVLTADAAYIVAACNAYPKLIAALRDARSRLEGFIGSDCECDNTHEQNGTQCCLCEYGALLRELGEI